MAPGEAESAGPASEPARAAAGRRLGPRALRTRELLLDATAELLREAGVRGLSVVEIARRVGTSPATFYQYFRDAEEALLQLAERAAEEVPALLERLDGPWSADQALATARAVVEGFVRHWETHHAALRVRDLAAEEGDRRFARVRRRALAPVLERLAARVAASQREGRLDPEIHPRAAAAALAAILERLSACRRELEGAGVGRDALVETCARILVQTLTGQGAA